MENFTEIGRFYYMLMKTKMELILVSFEKQDNFQKKLKFHQNTLKKNFLPQNFQIIFQDTKNNLERNHWGMYLFRI